MRKLVIVLLSVTGAVMFYFTMLYSIRVFSTDLSVPASLDGAQSQPQYRLVLISQELDTPFWAKVESSALAEARRSGVSMEVRGSYGMNEDDFLKNVEIAIASKVDGIIVQGLDTDEFKNLTKIKAAVNGIPVITVANDVPAAESLRRTYVGSDHLEAGRMIARQLLSDMGFSGKVVLIVSDRQEEFQRSRLSGILDVLQAYPNIKPTIVAAGDTREKIVAATNQVLNEAPDAEAFIAVTAAYAEAIVQEIGRRTKIEDRYIYSFDDSPETLTLLKQGKIDALIAQSPEAMGEGSVKRMVQWLKGEELPLNSEGYYTDIRVLRSGEIR